MAHRLIQISQHLGVGENRIKQFRELYPLDKQQLNNLIFTPKYANIKKESLNIMIQNRHIFKHGDIQDMNRDEERERSVYMMLTYQSHRRNYVVDPQRYTQDPHALAITAHANYNFDPGFSVKNDIHYFLYFKTLYAFHTSQLHKQIIQQALKMEHIGCFGLTELGHGSNARSILTECIYNHNTKEFIVNTPNNLGMKFWIGAAAQLANMSIIWAQLVIDGNSYGPHPFIVPIRNPKTHQPYPGVTIGDCGPKNGCTNIDNGFIMFKNHRIPKGYLLDKLSGVDDNGKFYAHIENPEKRFGTFMGPLSYGRSFVALNSISTATAALAISIRYCCTRRQFSSPNEIGQRLIIDYPMMKYRLMPLLAQTVVYYFGGAKILRTYDEKLKQILDPTNKIVEEMHALSAVLKVITQSREACGGHGFSSLSRLGRLYHDQDINLTWEGDNNMLLQQCTKYILKTSRKLSQGKNFQSNTLYFINQTIDLPQNITRQDFQRPQFLQLIIKKRLNDALQNIISAMMKFKGEGLSDTDVWNRVQPHYGKTLSYAFGDLYYFTELMRATIKCSQTMKIVLHKCLQLWLMSTLQQQRWGNIKLRNIIKQQINQLCEWINKRSISILDSIAQPNQIINSVFADENGDGMKKYYNAFMTGKTTFKFYDWQEQIPFMRDTMKQNSQTKSNKSNQKRQTSKSKRHKNRHTHN